MRSFIYTLFFLFLLSCSQEPSVNKEPEEFKVQNLSQIQQVKPEKPVKIKLKRDAQGRYSWELSGDNAEEIVKIDRKLRKTFIPEASGQ